MERPRDRVNIYENGDLRVERERERERERGREKERQRERREMKEKERERERERICDLFGENGFDELESDILFLCFFCFGFVNCLGLLIIE